MTRELLAAAGIVITSSVVCGTAQVPESLRARAKAEGGTVTQVMHVDFSEYSVPQLASKADAIVHGRVVSVRARLSADESTVVTDVTIIPIRVLKQITPVTTRAKPGATVPLIVRHVGGTVVEQELKMSTLVDSFPLSEEFAVGDEVVCFLLFESSQGLFELVDGPYAAFRVRGGTVQTLTKDAARRLRHQPAPVAAFVARVVDQIRGR